MQKLTEAEALSLIEIVIPHVTCGEAKEAIERLKEAGTIIQEEHRNNLPY